MDTIGILVGWTEVNDDTLFFCAGDGALAVSYTHLRAHETVLDLVCRLLLEKKKNTGIDTQYLQSSQ